MEKELLLSVTEKDCDWDYFRGSGAGGQKRNKTSSACRCTHKNSGASGMAQDGRSQRHNRELAFQRMAQTKTFQVWLRKKSFEIRGLEIQVRERVNQMMREVKIEIQEDGKWREES